MARSWDATENSNLSWGSAPYGERGIGAKQGGCRIIAPRGDVIAQAAVGEETVLTASVSLEAVLKEKANIDVGGHYSRPDVLQPHVNRRPPERVLVSDAGATPGDDRMPSRSEHQEETKEVKNRQLGNGHQDSAQLLSPHRRQARRDVHQFLDLGFCNKECS